VNIGGATWIEERKREDEKDEKKEETFKNLKWIHNDTLYFLSKSVFDILFQLLLNEYKCAKRMQKVQDLFDFSPKTDSIFYLPKRKIF
jgi:hypothetical protein